MLMFVGTRGSEESFLWLHTDFRNSLNKICLSRESKFIQSGHYQSSEITETPEVEIKEDFFLRLTKRNWFKCVNLNL